MQFLFGLGIGALIATGFTLGVVYGEPVVLNPKFIPPGMGIKVTFGQEKIPYTCVRD